MYTFMGGMHLLCTISISHYCMLHSCYYYYFVTLYSCNMGRSGLPDIYTRSPRAAGPRAKGLWPITKCPAYIMWITETWKGWFAYLKYHTSQQSRKCYNSSIKGCEAMKQVIMRNGECTWKCTPSMVVLTKPWNKHSKMVGKAASYPINVT